MYNRTEKTDIVLNSLREGQPFYSACKLAGIDVSTLWKWRRADEELDKEIEEIRTSRTQLVEDALLKNCLQGDTNAQKFWLKNRGRNWAEGPLIHNETHESKIYVWKGDRDSLRTSTLSESNSRLPE